MLDILNAPTDVFAYPVVLVFNETYPIPTFCLPVVFVVKAKTPKEVFCEANELAPPPSVLFAPPPPIQIFWPIAPVGWKVEIVLGCPEVLTKNSVAVTVLLKLAEVPPKGPVKVPPVKGKYPDNPLP